MEENKPRGHKIFVNYAAQIKGDTKNRNNQLKNRGKVDTSNFNHLTMASNEF